MLRSSTDTRHGLRGTVRIDLVRSVTARQPRVSIGLPVYNGELYLRAAIESLLAQTLTDFELIISDNASTDATGDICRDYAARDRRVLYIRRPTNVGVTRNFNDTLSHATAPYFKWMSSDDLVAPDMLARCVEALDRDSSLVLVHAKTGFVGEHGEAIPHDDSRLHLVEEHPHQRLRALWDRLRFCNAQFGVMRLDAMRRTGLFGAFIGSDICFLAELCLQGGFVELPDTLLFRRLHRRAASKMRPDQLIEHYRLARKRLILYNWRHLFEYVRIASRAPLHVRERLRVFRLVAQRAIWNRRELMIEIGVIFRHLAGRPHPFIVSPGYPDDGGPRV